MGSWRVDANSMSDFHNPDGTMKPAREIPAMWDEWNIEPTQQAAFYCGTGWRASEAFFYAWLDGLGSGSAFTTAMVSEWHGSANPHRHRRAQNRASN